MKDEWQTLAQLVLILNLTVIFVGEKILRILEGPVQLAKHLKLRPCWTSHRGDSGMTLKPASTIKTGASCSMSWIAGGVIRKKNS